MGEPEEEENAEIVEDDSGAESDATITAICLADALSRATRQGSTAAKKTGPARVPVKRNETKKAASEFSRANASKQGSQRRELLNERIKRKKACLPPLPVRAFPY